MPRPWDRAYSYTSETFLEPGTVVHVDFNGKILPGLVSSCVQKTNDAKFKPINKVLGVLNSNVVKWIQHETTYHAVQYGVFLKLLLRKDIVPFKPRVLTLRSENLTPQQKTAVEELSVLKSIFLLYGATGAGKTAVYLEKVKQALDENGQVLILLPEILLASQFQAIEKPYLWHSKVAKPKKDEIWSWAISGQPGVVIGTRSALFLPFNNLKLIIIDEEHDQSYKQDASPRYHAREVAIRRAFYCNAQVILVSATPSFESFYATMQSKYQLVILPHTAALPEVFTHKLESPISADLMSAVCKNAEDKRASIILINRRGYASIASCASCRRKIMCRACSVHLAWHKSGLKCHWCGVGYEWPKKCICDSTSWTPVGWGLERIYDWIQKEYPQLRVACVSSDITNNALQDLRTGDLDLVIGTQVLSQGHHIPTISLVGIIDPPEIGDFRARERLYQLITQTRGRAGRDGTASIAWWETDNPKKLSALFAPDKRNESQIKPAFVQNLFIPALPDKEFYLTQLQLRYDAKMPPFTCLTAIIISAAEVAQVQQVAMSIKKMFVDLEVWGPSPAPLFKINNLHRWRLLLRGDPIQEVLKTIYNLNSKVVKVEIDRNPYHFY